MIKKCLLKVCLRAYLFFFLSNIAVGYAQDNSLEYLTIKNDTILTNNLKEVKIDSLITVYKKHQDKQTFLAYDLYDYMVWQYRNGSLDKAIEISKRCIQTINQVPIFDSLKHKKIYNNLGFFYIRKGDNYNAYRTYRELTTVGKVDSFTARAYQLTGRALMYIGDFYKAAEYYEKSVSIALEIQDFEMAIGNSIDAGINYKEIDTKESLNQGVKLLTDASKLAEKINESADNEREKISSDLLFSLYNHLANAYSDRDDYDFEKSKFYFNKSLSLAEKLKDSLKLSIVYNDFGYLYVHDAQPKALEYLKKAQVYKPRKKLKSIIFSNLGLYYHKRNDLENAMRFTQKAINELTPTSIDDFKSLPSKNSVSKSIDTYELLQNLIDKGKLWVDIYEKIPESEKLINALETFKLADHLVDEIRAESSNHQSKLFWRKTASEIYLNAVKVCFKLDNLEDGFYFMEKNKALLLLEDVSLRQQREEATIPESIFSREILLKRDIIAKTKILEAGSDIDSLRAAVFNSKEIYDSFMDSIQERHQLFYRSQKTAQTTTLNEVQQSLKESKEAYIEYILNEDNGYGMLVTGMTANFFEIEDAKSLFVRSQKLRKLLSLPFKIKQDEELYVDLAHSIYNDLFPDLIKDDIKDKKLIIIPDSYLQNIPFEALLTSTEKTSYAIKQHEINYAYSISFLNQSNRWKQENTNDFIGFAPVNFNNNLSKLPDSEFELQRAASLFSAVNFLNTDANTQNFIDNIKGYNIIHIASHANAIDGINPWIVFDDKKLSLDELYLTQNTADLVVLSACKTSIGTLNEGEGVMSLARGFFNTGAQSVMSTLWSVNDKSGAQIIADFYKELKKGKSKSNALRTAKLKYLETHQLSQLSPYYWSSLVLIGDSGSVSVDTNNNLLKIILLVGLALIISYLLYTRIIK